MQDETKWLTTGLDLGVAARPWAKPGMSTRHRDIQYDAGESQQELINHAFVAKHSVDDGKWSKDSTINFSTCKCCRIRRTRFLDVRSSLHLGSSASRHCAADAVFLTVQPFVWTNPST